MVEILEYMLAFAISSGVAAFGFVMLNGYLPTVGKVAASSEFTQVLDAAQLSLAENSAHSVTLYLDNGTVACSAGRMTFSAAGLTFSSSLPGGCSFSYAGLSGLKTLRFVANDGVLDLEVSG